MNGIDILQIATATIISAGGIGAIIIAAVQFTSNIIADKISKKYELKLNESLESYKSNLDKCCATIFLRNSDRIFEKK